MPTMYEIYQKHAIEYDDLVSHEDVEGNLDSFLSKKIHRGSKVLELGVGTGRLTRGYVAVAESIVCCDRSEHMIKRAKVNLKRHDGKIEYLNLDSRDIGNLDDDFDHVVEGWSLGHTAIEEYDRLSEFACAQIGLMRDRLKAGGSCILFETLGTNTQEPRAPSKKLSDFYNLLEAEYGFRKVVLRTDYEFETLDIAKKKMGFFFGEDIEYKIQDTRIREFTGVWSLDI